MLLAVDAGNTNIVLGLYKKDKLVESWRISTDLSKTADEYSVILRSLFSLQNITLNSVQAVIIASVVPPVVGVLEKMIRQTIKKVPLFVGPGIKTGIKLKFDNPRELGADRIVNAVSAFETYGGPVMIIDFGTATTYDMVTAKGEYVGGVIAPGINVSLDALVSRASKLPRVELEKPAKIIATNTVKGIQSGSFYGYLAQIEGIVARAKKEMGLEKMLVLATGGLAEIFYQETEAIDKIDPDLTLRGLKILYEKNKEKNKN